MNPCVVDEDKLQPSRLVFIAASAAYCALCVFFLSHSTRWWLGYTADDAFYYLQIARHIASRGKSSFDGTTTTNGYHPAWMGIVTVLAELFRDREALFRASLVVQFLLHYAGCCLLVRLMSRFVPQVWAALCGCAWLFNPYALRTVMGGVETALVIVAFLLAILAYYSKIDPYVREGKFEELPTRNIVLFALALALSVLSRSDGAIFAAIVLACASIAALRGTGARNLARFWGVSVGIIALCVAPWLIYSYAQTHTIVQDSGVMKALWTNAHVGSSPAAIAKNCLDFLYGHWIVTNLNMAAGNWAGRSNPVGALLLILVLAPFLFGVVKRVNVPFAWLSTALLCNAVVNGIAFSFVDSDFQIWHGPTTVLSYVIVGFGWLGVLVERLSSAPACIASTAAAIAIYAAPALSLISFTPSYPWQRDMYDRVPLVDQILATGQRVGAFNAGILGYFSSGPIVDLDGLVNHQVIAYWKEGRVNDYLVDQRIAFVTDEMFAMSRAVRFSHRGSHALSLRILYATPMQGWSSQALWCVIKVTPAN